MLILVRLISPAGLRHRNADAGYRRVYRSGLIRRVRYARTSASRSGKNRLAGSFSAAGLVINSALFVVAIATAYVLSQMPRFQAVGLPLSVGVCRSCSTYLQHCASDVQVEHDWMRFRALIMTGTLLAYYRRRSSALVGGGVWALVIQPLLFGFPATVDLF